ncbi:MAG: lysoplasmalogenase [Acidimicrobiia bacterium]|nr:lysoplasmalogenase [Acidimicrobiia bacterium]
MTFLAWTLLACTSVVALVDWWAVRADRRRVEYVAKPLTMVALLGVVLALDTSHAAARWWFVAAVLWSLAGDVALMLPDRRRFFPVGLGAFLVAHLAYVVGLWSIGVTAEALTLGLVVVGLVVATVGRRIVAGVAAAEPALRWPVVAYVAVISAMVVSAVGTASPLAVLGAVSFYGSDALIAWTNFMVERSWGRLAVMVTYHVGQILLVVSLV